MHRILGTFYAQHPLDIYHLSFIIFHSLLCPLCSLWFFKPQWTLSIRKGRKGFAVFLQNAVPRTLRHLCALCGLFFKVPELKTLLSSVQNQSPILCAASWGTFIIYHLSFFIFHFMHSILRTFFIPFSAFCVLCGF